MTGSDFFEGPDKKIVEDKMSAVFLEGAAEAEAELVTKQGQRISYYFTGKRKIIDGKPLLVGLGINFTKRRQAEDKVRELIQFRDSIIDNPHIWLNVLDENANVVIWNNAAEKISGYSREEVVGRSDIWAWCYPDEKYREEITLKASSIIEGDQIEDFETTITSKDGNSKVMSWYSRNLLDKKENIIGSIALGLDVTDRKQAEMEREELIKDLQTALEQVKQLSGLLPICANCKKNQG